MKCSWVALSVVCLMCAGVAGAAVQQGDAEINLSGSFVGVNGDTDRQDTTIWSVDTFLGYFLTDNIEVGVAGNGQWSDVDGATPQDLYMYGVGGLARYFFTPANLWVPYVGAQARWEWLSGYWTVDQGSADGFMYGPLAGVRFELNAKNDFFVEYQYQIFAGELNEVYDSAHVVLLGIAHQFR